MADEDMIETSTAAAPRRARRTPSLPTRATPVAAAATTADPTAATATTATAAARAAHPAGSGRPAGLVGRDAELARLRAAVARAAGGQATVVAVVGAYGLGKTTLLDALRTGPLRGSHTVLSTLGRAADAELGFASLLTLLRPVEDRLDDLAGDLAPALRAALALDGRRADPVAVRVATLRTLSALAAEGPLVLLVDDAHLLDQASADVLAFAAGRFQADAVAVVVATERYAPTAFDDLGPETILLEELGDDEIARVIGATVPLAPEPLRRCVELADGNPLAGRELAASLDPAQRSGAAPMPVVPRLGGVIGNAFARRIERLGGTARNALALLAADDTGELAVVADALAHLGEPPGGLAEAEAAGLVATDGATIRFTHPLLRPVAYHQIGAASRRAAHRALAAVLAAPHQGPSRAWQQVAAADRPDAEVAASLALVAGDVARRGGPASAARTLECAAALAPGPDQRRDLLVGATRAWAEAGEGRAAARVAEALTALPATGESVAVAAGAFRGVRPAPEVLTFVGGALDAVAGDAAERAATAAVLADEMLAAGAVDDAVALARTLAGDATPAARLARAVLAAAGEPLGPDEPDGDTGTATGTGPGNPDDLAVPATDPVAERAALVAAEAAADGGRRVDPGPGAAAWSVVAVGGGGLDLAVSRALATLHAGRVADAHDQLLRLDALRRDGAGPTRTRLDLALAEVELLLGRPDDAAARADAVAARAAELGLGRLRARAGWVRGRIALAAGDDRTAVEHLRAATRVLPHLAIADLVTATAADRPTEAATHAAAARRSYAGHPTPVVAVRALRAAGSLGARTDLDAALARAEAAGLPLEAAAVVLARAELARRSGDDEGAAAAAQEARSRWSACGVQAWEPRLARLERRVPATSSLAARLSPAEHRVALAVAEGRTNQEAAATLFLSVKTVDFHLQNIYRKLGLRSRTELAVVVHGAGPERVAS
ncbi:MAG TPA: AAA family ATPase [Acidimicrobiales bacterium]